MDYLDQLTNHRTMTSKDYPIGLALSKRSMLSTNAQLRLKDSNKIHHDNSFSPTLIHVTFHCILYYLNVNQSIYIYIYISPVRLKCPHLAFLSFFLSFRMPICNHDTYKNSASTLQSNF
ncbi:hypothetical protein BCR41DRAFT_242910 [Lobosporangium transversale]|uniref:Uncharacterized protein n=1 Tax=Lobosporangium transversale TaxID=64571 RepID=A0A1Y2G5A1_9FUNG|nr:hypothetical protein BCR41DRAFT_242910 [Lobosporangium transversale]ORY94339.1 hypothetical protein BCR41DRAFT_242910 [Lobosporangium transversale]|eukprot:XP_021875281.1 hypothetical protein BCR41DRAFT_242910 [Lobosporangium transversale]